MQKKTPQRLCVGCQQLKTKKELMRVVRTPENEVLLDVTGKKSGRGVYICSDDQCLAKAFKEKKLERALKRVIEPQVYEQLRAGIVK